MPRPIERLALLVGLVLWAACAAAQEPRHVVLTWQGDPTTTMTVNFQTDPDRVLVGPGATWRYSDADGPAPDGWTGTDFDDSAWATGAAPLGYGDERIATTLDHGGDARRKRAAAYFRLAFEVGDPDEVGDAVLDLLRDDGAVVHLNGREIGRTNIADGPVDHETLAPRTCSDDGREWQSIAVEGRALRAGRNVLAVEVHQASRSSSDLVFEAILRAAAGAGGVESVVRFDTRSGGGDPEAYRKRATGRSHRIAGVGDRIVHRVELTGLEPGRTYWFVAGDGSAWTAERKFRTIPADDVDLRFATGGDMGVDSHVPQLLARAAAEEPRFALIGGDIAYANGSVSNIDRWDAWLGHWSLQMVTPEGYTVPVLLAIGNHEVRGSYGKTADEAPFYFGLFAQEGRRSYFVRDLGPRLSFFVLDSGHVTSHGGDQREWLDRELARRKDRPYRMAVYHVPLYPSHRDEDGGYSAAGRRFWGPLFDRHRLTVAFENHDHTLKRTHRLKGGEIDEEGTLYLGDGCWGRSPREVHPDRWYLAHAASVRHVWIVDVESDGIEARALDEEGAVADRVTLRR